MLHLVAPGAVAVASSGNPILGAFVAHMSGADFFGLIVAVLVIAYLFYALIRGEKL
jgi:K+-transporting ATPase KdpF subunit